MQTEEQLNQINEEQITQAKIVDKVNELAHEQEGTPELNAVRNLMAIIPHFKTKLENVTGTQAKRVLSRLIETPFENDTAPFTTPEASELFQMGVAIQAMKYVLFLKGAQENANRDIQEVADENATLAKQTQGEDSNGN